MSRQYRAGEFVTVPNIRLMAQVGSSAFAVFSYLCWRAGKDKTAFPSYSLIEVETGVSRRTAIRSVQELQTKGWIKRVERKRPNGSHTSNSYLIMQLDKDTAGGDNLAPCSDKNDTGGSDKNDTPITITNKNNNHLTTNVVETSVSYGNPEINKLFDYWKETTGLPISEKVQMNRNNAATLLKQHPYEVVEQLIRAAAASQLDKYSGLSITNLIDLQQNKGKLIIWAKKQRPSAQTGVAQLWKK